MCRTPQHFPLPTIIFCFIISHHCVILISFTASVAGHWRSMDGCSAIYRISSYIAHGLRATIDVNLALLLTVLSGKLIRRLQNDRTTILRPVGNLFTELTNVVTKALCLSTLLHVIGHVVCFSLEGQNWGGILCSVPLAIVGSYLMNVFIDMRCTSLHCVRQL